MHPRIANSNSRMKANTADLANRSTHDSFKKLVMQALGDLDGYEPLGTTVLCATYVQPARTAGGILLPDKSVDEDRWQGKLNLVLKLGEQAFRYADHYQQVPYQGPRPKVGEYVLFHPQDGRELFIRNTSCRIVDSALIRMIVRDDPDAIF